MDARCIVIEKEVSSPICHTRCWPYLFVELGQGVDGERHFGEAIEQHVDQGVEQRPHILATVAQVVALHGRPDEDCRHAEGCEGHLRPCSTPYKP